MKNLIDLLSTHVHYGPVLIEVYINEIRKHIIENKQLLAPSSPSRPSVRFIIGHFDYAHAVPAQNPPNTPILSLSVSSKGLTLSD